MSQLDLAWAGHARDGSPRRERSPADQFLVTQITESIWLGRDPDGRTVTARRLAGVPDVATAELAGMTERVGTLASWRMPSLVPVLGVRCLDRALWLVSEPDHGVSLSRLLELTRPTPAQAVFVGLGVVGGVRALHTAGFAHGTVCPDDVRIDDDGRIRLDGWAAGILVESPEPLDRRQRADITALGGLLAGLAGAARRSSSPAGRRTPSLLTALDAAVDYAALPGADVELVAEPLKAVAATVGADAGPDQESAVRSELAALVAVSIGNAAALGRQLPSAPPAATSLRVGARQVPQTWQKSRLGAGLRNLWRQTWTWLVALAVLAGVVSLEIVLLQDRLAQDVGLLLGEGRSGQSADSLIGPIPSASPVPEPAPAKAGAVSGVDLRALEPCTPEAACLVRVLVRLEPQSRPQPVAWTFQVIDRCTGSRHDAPGGSVSVVPDGEQAQAVSTVSLPPGRALAVLAVTSEPASAASRPLLVPTGQDSC